MLYLSNIWSLKLPIDRLKIKDPIETGRSTFISNGIFCRCPSASHQHGWWVVYSWRMKVHLPAIFMKTRAPRRSDPGPRFSLKITKESGFSGQHMNHGHHGRHNAMAPVRPFLASTLLGKEVTSWARQRMAAAADGQEDLYHPVVLLLKSLEIPSAKEITWQQKCKKEHEGTMVFGRYCNSWATVQILSKEVDLGKLQRHGNSMCRNLFPVVAGKAKT